MIARSNLFTVKGGDTVQIIETANALKKIGVDIDIIISKNIDYNKYQLLHFFNIINPEIIIYHTQKTNLPYVVSTIYVDYSEFEKKHRTDFLGAINKLFNSNAIEYFKVFAKTVLFQKNIISIKYFLLGHKNSIQHIIENTSILLPNSHNEYVRLANDFDVKKKHLVIPNAVNLNLFKENKSEKRNLVLCVARIEGRKNQLNIIRALKNTEYQIVFIGAEAPNQKKYAAQCRSEATSNMKFINHINQEELLFYYSQAKVHILASWFETTGLSSLEAGVMGCNIVVANRGDVKDYFLDYAEYCEPNDLTSIKNAVDVAHNKSYNPQLKQYILTNYTWEKAAEKTHTAYKEVLSIQ